MGIGAGPEECWGRIAKRLGLGTGQQEDWKKWEWGGGEIRGELEKRGGLGPQWAKRAGLVGEPAREAGLDVGRVEGRSQRRTS